MNGCNNNRITGIFVGKKNDAKIPHSITITDLTKGLGRGRVKSKCKFIFYALSHILTVFAEIFPAIIVKIFVSFT